MVNGTARLSKLAPDTPYAYVQSFARELRAQLHGQTLYGMASESYIKIFQTLLDASVRHAPYKVAGLKAFHLFLRANWDVPPLPASIFKVDIDAAVAANVVWPAELATIEHWIDTAPATRFN